MLQIRKSVYETNSSSTHSICITRKGISSIELPEKIVFKHGEFGWDEKKLKTPEEKASYLYQAICAFYEEKERNKVINEIYSDLAEFEVDAKFEPEIKTKYGVYGYIDHPYELKDWLEKILGNKKRLIRYLFSEESFVCTGNDNDDSDIDIFVNYRHEEYYKSN